MNRTDYDIIVHHQTDAIEKFKEEWTGLVGDCPAATLYQTWEWNEAWWRIFHKGKSLYLIALRSEGRLIALAPFYISRHLGTPLRRLAFLGTGVSDFLDLIIRRGEEAESVRVIMDHLLHSKRFDLADLQQLRPCSSLLKEGAQTSPPNAAVRIRQEPCPYLPLPPAWEEYTKTLGKKMRSNISYYERLLPRTYENCEYHMVEADELDEGLTELFNLHQRRWKARMLPGVLGGDAIQSFHRLVAKRCHDAGWLRLHRLRVDGETVAALYCFHYGLKYYYYLGGFEPRLAKFSIGTILTAHAIRNAIYEGCEEFDFLRGDEPYKYRWSPLERFNHRLLISRPHSFRSGLMLRLNRLERYVEHKAKTFAEHRGRRKP